MGAPYIYIYIYDVSHLRVKTNSVTRPIVFNGNHIGNYYCPEYVPKISSNSSTNL